MSPINQESMNASPRAKTLVPIILMTLTGLFWLTSSAKAQEKTAICNMRQVVESYPGFAAMGISPASSGHDQPNASKEAMAAKLQQTINATRDPAKRLQLVEQLRKLKSDVQEGQTKLQQQSAQSGMAMRMKAMQTIKDAVAQVAKKEGYNMVYDSSTAIYTDGSNDITAEVVKIVATMKPLASAASGPIPSTSPPASPASK